MKAILALGALVVGGGAVFLAMKHPTASANGSPLPPPGKGICFTQKDVWDGVEAISNDPKSTSSDLRTAANVLQTEHYCDDAAKQAAIAGAAYLNGRAQAIDSGVTPPPFVNPLDLPPLPTLSPTPIQIGLRTSGRCEACDE